MKIKYVEVRNILYTLKRALPSLAKMFIASVSKRNIGRMTAMWHVFKIFEANIQ